MVLANRASGDKVIFYADFSQMAEVLGAVAAMSSSLKSKRYQNNLIDVAFTEADEEFNVVAAAFARATGRIAHMYEWGTVGINRGKSNRRPDAMSENARLWENKALGNGFGRTLTYYFKPSTAYVPKPTKGATGMSANDIELLNSKQVYTWKAEMMEWGRELTVSPQRAKVLVIPITKENKENHNKRDVERGYWVTKDPVTFTAGGEHYYGEFEIFFRHFWENQGEEMLNISVQRQLLFDFEPKYKDQKRFRGLVPASTGKTIKARVAEAQAEIEAEVMAESTARAKAVKK